MWASPRHADPQVTLVESTCRPRPRLSSWSGPRERTGKKLDAVHVDTPNRRIERPSKQARSRLMFRYLCVFD